MIKILIGNLTSKIVGYLPDIVHNELDSVLSYRLKDAIYLKIVKEKKWDGVYHLYRKNYGQSFYSGLLALAAEVLTKNKIPFQLIDERIRPEQNLPNLTFTPPPGFEERDYQTFTIDRAIKSTRGILKMATGSGKTNVATQMIAKIKTYPFMFYVLTTDLMTQAHGVLSKTLNEPIGKIGGGNFDVQKINVCMIQTAVLAVNLDNQSFKISDYKFDEEDEWNEAQLDSAEKKQILKNLIWNSKGLVTDECVDGDTDIITEHGKTKIKDVKDNKCRFVQTYDGNNIVFRKILDWKNIGLRNTITITLKNNKEIICTKEHLFYTERGWVEAQNLLENEKLFVANADVGEKFLLPINTDRKDIYWDIKLKGEQKKNGQKFIKHILKNCQSVNADVAKKFFLNIRHWINLLMDKVLKVDMQNIFWDTTNSHLMKNIISCQLKKKSRLLLGHVLETPLLDCPIIGPKITDYILPMDYVRENGPNIKQIFCADIMSKQKLCQVLDLEKCRFFLDLRVFHLLQKLPYFFTEEIEQKKNKLQKRYWMNLVQLELLGGYAMMAQIMREVLSYILKGGVRKKTKESEIGLLITDLNAECSNIQKEMKKKQKYFIILDLIQKALKNCQNILSHMSPNVCDTNWIAIKNIKKDGEKNVYDIEVQDTHCFFANNILVHNCHHTSCRSIRDVLLASPNAFWRYGASATPYREDGAEIMIQAMFGKKIVDISASYLIKNKYLIEPYIIFDPIQHDEKLNSYPTIYKKCIVQNESFNSHVADIAKHLIANGMSVLILVQQYPQGDYIKSLIPNTEFLTGKMRGEKREEIIQELRDRRKLCLIATALFDEGIDVPTLDAVLLAGGGSSSTRVHQRIGRALRIDKTIQNPRDKALIVYFEHHGVKYLDKHARKARRIIKMEPSFHIVDSAGPQYILNEIDEIMDNKSTVFSV